MSGRRDNVAVSLFSGALGLDLGLERAGFRIAVAVESNKFAAETIRRNRPDIEVIERDIRKVRAEEILELAGLKKGEVAVVSGGPSCQSFSTAGGRGSLSDPRGGLFREFLRIVRGVQPRFFVLENVRGILSAAVRHRPLAKRGPGFPPLEEDELLGSALKVVLRSLNRVGYRVIYDLLNAASYGVPQTRHRVIFLGSRDGEDVRMPEQTHSEDEWVTLKQALAELDDLSPEYIKFPPSRAKFLRRVPAGGNWRDLPTKLQREALGKAYVSWGGRSGFCRRLGWDSPSPALTTRPDSKATVLCHPDELRPLSVREYSRIQQFPDDWEFVGGRPQKYKMIGNAVPLGLGEAIGRALFAAMRRRRKQVLVQGVECASEELLARMAKRPRIILNPPRMRRGKTLAATRRWVAKSLNTQLSQGKLSAPVKIAAIQRRSDEPTTGRKGSTTSSQLQKKKASPRRLGLKTKRSKGRER